MASNKIKIDVEVANIKKVKDLSKELESITSKINKYNEQIKNTNKLTAEEYRELKSLEKQQKELTKSLEKISSVTDKVGDSSKRVAAQYRDLRNRMRELAVAGQENTEEFQKLEAQAVELDKAMFGVGERLKDLAKNRGIDTLAPQIKAVGQSLLSLDFNRAASQAEGLAKISKSITFDTAITSLKSLGKTFIQLGRALLTNPLFLIAGTIAGIVVAFKKLSDAVGITELVTKSLGKAFNWLMTPINALIDSLKRLTDWLGWTNHAARELAETQAEESTKALKISERETRQRIANLKFERNNIENKIKLITGSTDEEIKEKMRLQKELSKIDTEINIENQRQLAERIGNNNKELQRLSVETGGAISQIRGQWKILNDADLSEEQLDQINELIDTSVDLNVTLANTLEEYNNIETNLTTTIEGLTDTLKKNLDDRIEEQKRNNKAYSDLLKEREKLDKEYEKGRTDADRKLEKIRIDLIQDEFEKQRQQLSNNYKVEIEDLEAHYEDLFEVHKGNQERIDALTLERDLIIEQLEVLRDQQISEINKNEIESIRLHNLELLAIERQFQEDFREISKSSIPYEDTHEGRIAKAWDDHYERMRIIDEQHDDLMEQLRIQLEEKMITEAEYENLGAEIKEQADLRRLESEQLVNNEITESRQQMVQQVAQATLQVASFTQNILNQLAQNIDTSSKEGFEQNKKLQIATGIIGTIQSAIQAFQAMAGIPYVGPALGAVAAGAAVAAGMANVAKIKNQQYESTGVKTPTIPTMPTSTNISNAPIPTTPDFFGVGFDGSSSGDDNLMKVYVLESDISNAQNNVNVLEQSSTIG